MKQCFFLLCYTLSAFYLFAQTSDDKYRAFNNHTVDSLSKMSSMVMEVRFDTNNVLWAATNEGLVKYDGAQWRVFGSNSPLAGNSLDVLAIDSKNNLWMASAYNIGLVKFDGANSWTFYNTQNTSIPSNKVNSIAIDKNNIIWLASPESGLIKFDGTSFTTYNGTNGSLPTNIVSRVYIDSPGNKWLVCGQGWGIIKLNATATSYTTYNETRGKDFTTIYQDTKGKMWVGTYFDGAVYLEDNIWKAFPADRNHDLASAFIWSFGKDKEGSVLLGTVGYGLWKYKNETLTHIGEQIDLVKYSVVNSIALDKEYNTWLGTPDTGFVKIQSSEVTSVNNIIPRMLESVVYFPSPCVGGLLQGNYVSDKPQTIHVRVCDISGRVVNQYLHNLVKGDNPYRYDLSHLTSGVYFMQVNYKERSVTQKVSIIN